MESAALARRMKEARLHAGVRTGDTVSQERMAELVGKQLRRNFHVNQWRRYEIGETEPPLEVIRATARVSGLSAAYIAFGDAAAADPTASAPAIPEQSPSGAEVAARVKAGREAEKSLTKKGKPRRNSR